MTLIPQHHPKSQTRNPKPHMPPILIGTRGSALALAQANLILAQCRSAFSDLAFELKIIKTTGDKLQTASLAQGDLPKGLFTKELEVALTEGHVDLCVHSLKDLPTELPPGLMLGATTKRADVRDVLVYRDAAHLQPADARRGFAAKLTLAALPDNSVIATGSTRRRAQLLALRPDLRTIEIRGNVATRLQKLSERAEMDATILALAGLIRLDFHIAPGGQLTGNGVPHGLFATVLDVDAMLPCVGQGAIGIEIRERDERIAAVCATLNDHDTFQSVTAERAFLSAMGGGCQAPVAAYAEAAGGELHMRAVSFMVGCKRAEAKRAIKEAVELGAELAAKLKS